MLSEAVHVVLWMIAIYSWLATQYYHKQANGLHSFALCNHPCCKYIEQIFCVFIGTNPMSVTTHNFIH